MQLLKSLICLELVVCLTVGVGGPLQRTRRHRRVVVEDGHRHERPGGAVVVATRERDFTRKKAALGIESPLGLEQKRFVAELCRIVEVFLAKRDSSLSLQAASAAVGFAGGLEILSHDGCRIAGLAELNLRLCQLDQNRRIHILDP